MEQTPGEPERILLQDEDPLTVGVGTLLLCLAATFCI